MGEFLEAMQMMKGAKGGSKGPPPIPQAAPDPLNATGAAPQQATMPTVGQAPAAAPMQPQNALGNIMSLIHGQPQQNDAMGNIMQGGGASSPISRLLELFHVGGQ